MKHIKIISLFIAVFLLTSCASMRKPVTTYFDGDSISNYMFFYVTPTNELTSSSGVYGNQYGVYGGYTKSINPADIISGILLKNGYVRVAEIKEENKSKTMVVNYGESGRRNVNLGYSIEVTIQFTNAETQNPIVICVAEGQGSTEADDIRKAINRALEPLFK